MLGEYICALGAKGAAMFRDGDPTVDNGWQKRFVPAQDGAVNYEEIYSLLLNTSFDGPTIFMPFYYGDDYEKMIATFKEEIKYIDGCYEKARHEVK